MKFTLQYSGSLPPSGSAPDKQRIRRAFHSQLERVWLNHPALSLYAKHQMALREGTLKGLHIETDGHLTGVGAWQYNMYGAALGGFLVVPLVREEHSVSCQLHIKFLRRGRPGDVTKGGDLDNRLKTLLDALRIPHYEDQLGGDKPATANERLYCLLEDDSLITGVSVDSDELLRNTSTSRAVLYIDVTLTSYLY